MDVKTELKRVKVRVADVAKSRDAWRDKAEAKQRQLEALQAQVQELQNQVSQEHQQASSPSSAAEKKKMSRRPPRSDLSRCRTIRR